MPKLTENYGFKKPLGTEAVLIDVLNENFDGIDEALTPPVADTETPTSESTKGKLASVLGWFANRIKAITGKSRWYETPATNLEKVAQHIGARGVSVHNTATTSQSGFMSTTDKAKLDGATSAASVNKLIMRDSSGRARIVSPSNDNDIANKNYVDVSIGNHKGKGGTEHHPVATPSEAGFMSTTDKTKLDNATATNTANRLMLRDASGRAKVSTPSASTDIANKNYVDSKVADYMDTAVANSIVPGIYTGNGSSTQEITLGFKPRAVFVYPVGQSSTYQTAGLATPEQNAVTSTSCATTYATEYNYHYVTIAITDTGFKVSYCSSSSHARTNYSGYKYVYIAFK